MPGLLSVHAAEGLDLKPDTADVVFLLTFESQEAWEGYQGHPAHRALVAEKIGPVVADKRFAQTRGWGTA